MPVSHLGLTVSQIRTSTSFYLAALQPLGYNYIGSRGDSIGLGVDEADFFLTQEPSGYRLAPTHIAFTARTRATVRECYAAALNAGARPSGPPSYRQDDCTCFNAAVEDPDGNTVEFIWRDSDFDVSPDYGRARTTNSYGRPISTRTQTLQVMNQSIPRAGIQRSRTEPVDGMPSKTVFGAMLGAAAGAVVGLAMLNTSRDSAREALRYSTRSRSRAKSDHSRDRAAKRSSSVNEGSKTGRHASQHLPTDFLVRRIEAKPYRDDENISYTRQKYTQHNQGQRKEIEAIEYGPSRFSPKRSATMPIEERNVAAAVYDRRSSVPHTSSTRRDSVISGATKTYRHGSGRARSSTTESMTVKPSKRDTAIQGSTRQRELPPSLVSKVPTYMAAQVPLPPSMVSRSHTSTTRPSRRSTFDAYYLPVDNDDDSDGLGETATIVPDDSISCVNISSVRKHKRSSSKKPSKAERGGSVMTLPIRSGRDENTRTRSRYSNA